jgi:hypothetical protein
MVTVTVPFHDFWHREHGIISFAGKPVAWRGHRDRPAKLAEHVSVEAGGFPPSGGTLAHPRLAALPGTVLRITAVPGDHDDLGFPGVRIVATGSEVDALQARRGALRGELAEVEAALEAARGRAQQ